MDGDLGAGDFSVWLREMRGALAGERAADVPCGGCTACCTSSQFVHVGPDEVDTLAHIPAELLFPAPRRPDGHMVLGYDERGHCPMLVDGACSIYEHRPRTCRTYDCRVLAAVAVAVAPDAGQPDIARRVPRWRFAHPTQADHDQHQAVEAAAAFLVEHAAVLPQGTAPAAQLAVVAIQIADLFLGCRIPPVADVAAALAASRPP